VSSRTCPDWPRLMEIAPDLQFMHYTVLERHVFNAEHTDPKVAEALRATHWYELREWTSTGPGAGR
jgi:hypothetical protein